MFTFQTFRITLYATSVDNENQRCTISQKKIQITENMKSRIKLCEKKFKGSSKCCFLATVDKLYVKQHFHALKVSLAQTSSTKIIIKNHNNG